MPPPPCVTLRFDDRTLTFDISAFQGSFTRLHCVGVADPDAIPSTCVVIPHGPAEITQLAWARLRAELVFDRKTGAVLHMSDRLTRFLIGLVRVGTKRNNTEMTLELGSSRQGSGATKVLEGLRDDIFLGKMPGVPDRNPTAFVEARPAAVTKRLEKRCQAVGHKSGTPTTRTMLLSKQRHGRVLCEGCLERCNNRFEPNSTVGRHRSVAMLRRRSKRLLIQLIDSITQYTEADMIAGMMGPGTSAAQARMFLCSPFLFFLSGLVEPTTHMAAVTSHTTNPLRFRLGSHQKEDGVKRGMPFEILQEPARHHEFFKTFMADCGFGQLRTTSLSLSVQAIKPDSDVTPFYGLSNYHGDPMSRMLVYAPFVELLLTMIRRADEWSITLRLAARGLGPLNARQTDARDPPYSLKHGVQPTIVAAECLLPELLYAALSEHTSITVIGSLDSSLHDRIPSDLSREVPTTGLFAMLVSAVRSPELSQMLTLDTTVGDLVPDKPSPRDLDVVAETQVFLSQYESEHAPEMPSYASGSLVPLWRRIHEGVVVPVMPLRYPEPDEERRSVMTPSPASQASDATTESAGRSVSSGDTLPNSQPSSVSCLFGSDDEDGGNHDTNNDGKNGDVDKLLDMAVYDSGGAVYDCHGSETVDAADAGSGHDDKAQRSASPGSPRKRARTN